MRNLLPFSQMLEPVLEKAGYPVLLVEGDDSEDKTDVLFIQFRDPTIPCGIYVNVTIEHITEEYICSLYERGHSGGDIEISEAVSFKQSEAKSNLEPMLALVANNSLLQRGRK